MEHIKTHKIHPVRLSPKDTISLHYTYEEDGKKQEKYLKLDKVEEDMLIDTVLVYRVGNEFGLKAGRAIIMGQDDGTYKDLPLSKDTVPVNRSVDNAIKEFYTS